MSEGVKSFTPHPAIRGTILQALTSRNQKQAQHYESLITSYRKLLDGSDSMRSKNMQLTLQVEKLREENLNMRICGAESAGSEAGTGSISSMRDERAQALEQKVFKLQEELTELHRRKGENAQQIIDLNNAIIEKDKELSLKEAKLLETKYDLENTDTLCKTYKSTMEELEATNQMLKDEQQALQITFTALESKFQKVREENTELVERWMALKASEADKINMANDIVFRAKQEQLKKEIAEAAKEPFTLLSDGSDEGGAGGSQQIFCATVSLPNKASIKLDAHDGEVNAVACGPMGRVIATGGGDKKIKLWEVVASNCESRGTLIGCNAAVMSIEFDPEETLLLASSNDFASRVWTVSDQRLRHTLTGHSSKVLSAKFLSGPDKIVSGSHDRTLKIWDLRSKACVRTIFAGSSCNDLVSSEGGTQIISGHFDKRIRFWDARSDSSNANEILLQGRVTSLDLSPDYNYLLSCSRDDALKLIDLRMKQVTATFGAEGLRLTCDWSKARFSPDGQYVSVGSSDGSIYIWNINTRRLERHVKEHSYGVVSLAWHPSGKELYSCDKHRKLLIWGDKW